MEMSFKRLAEHAAPERLNDANEELIRELACEPATVAPRIGIAQPLQRALPIACR